MQASGKTIVIVSHAMGALRSMCDRLAWMSHGQLKMVGQTREVIDSYLGDVHVDQIHDAGSMGTRWGSGEATIEAIEVVDGSGQAVPRVRTGDRIAVRSATA